MFVKRIGEEIYIMLLENKETYVKENKMKKVIIATNIFSLYGFFYVGVQVSGAKTRLEDFNNERKRIIAAEAAMAVGSEIILTEKEKKLNKILMKRKYSELDYWVLNPHHFNFSKHYFHYRDDIKNSKVYNIIRRMPKGGVLHLHTTLMMDAEYIVQLTYEDHLYACFENGWIGWMFSRTVPNNECSNTWKLIRDVRQAEGAEVVDNMIMKHFSMYTLDENFLNADVNSLWNTFHHVHKSTKSLLLYRPIFEKFLYDGFTKFFNDGVLFLELRYGVTALYELNGIKHDVLYTIKCMKRVVQRFKKGHPDFIGIKLIPTIRRNANVDDVDYALNLSLSIKKHYPDIFAGFDLVDQEDLGKPLIDYVPRLLKANEDSNLSYFFHAGETNWFGSTADENIVDAILLGTKRIGHANSLIKHPHLFNQITYHRIGLEINVISNVVLGLVRDIRLHPVATYLALGLPVVLSSDDPGVWGADPLSHDFYVTFVGAASKHADLRMLKQVASNSITYSALSNIEKIRCRKVFAKRWRQFVESVLRSLKGGYV